MTSRALLLLAGFLFAHSNTTIAQDASRLPIKIYRFDAGEQPSEDLISLDLTSTYNPEQQYGWTTPLSNAFTRPERLKFREPELLDGLTAKEIGFRADLPQGVWWLTLWMESGLEDKNTMQLSVNDHPIPLAWNAFDAPAEPRTTIQNTYRLFHKRVLVGQDGLSFNLTGQADSVRVLAFNIYPDPTPRPTDFPILSKLKEIGDYRETIYRPAENQTVFDFYTDRTDVLQLLSNQLPNASVNENFVSYWQDILERQIKAERLFAMRGWEWANKETGMGLFDRIHQAIMLLDGQLDQLPAAFPLYDRTQALRGRQLYWLKVEGSEPEEIANVRNFDLTSLFSKYPGDTLLTMYNGGKVDLKDECDSLSPSELAPEWANLQRETLCRLRSISHWWIQKQQADNGELGGKLGDDVEILRWWPALIMSGDTITYNGWKKLADGVWESGKLRDGYAKNVSDVEHASEFVSDTAPVMAMFSDDPTYTDRLRPSARHFENLWTGKTDHGNRFFKSSWFSSSALDETPPKNRDVPYNTRATKAIRYLAWKTGDPEANNLLTEWSAGWAEHATQTAKGKPRGVIPASVRYPDEAINGDGDNWYDADMYWSYYNWQRHAGSMMLDQLLFTYTMTGDDKFLAPLQTSLGLIMAELPRIKAKESFEPGSATWAAEKMLNNNRFWGVASQWRLYAGSTPFENLLAEYGTPYLKYRITKNEQHLENGLKKILNKIRYNIPLLTYEAIHTDRIYVTHDGSGSSHLKAMLTGDGIIEDMSPYPVVTWSNTGESFTALLTDASRTKVNIELFSFSKIITPVAKFWQLDEGEYELKMYAEDDFIHQEKFEIKGRGDTKKLTVPADRLVSISIQKIEN